MQIENYCLIVNNMKLQLLYHLDEDTKEKIEKEQHNRDSWAISDSEYEERYESIMQNFRLETELIMQWIGTINH